MSIRVLIISDAWHPQVNGVVRTYEYLCKELEEMGHTTDVIGPADFDFSIPMPFYPEIKLVVRPYKRLKRLIKDFAPDKIHIATEGPLGWAGRKYCVRHNIPFTTSYHTQFPDYVAKRFAWLIPPMYNAVHRQGIKYCRSFHSPAKSIMVATQSLEEQLTSWDFKTPVLHLSRGVEHSIFYPGPKTILQDAKGPIALYVGRIAIEKNLEAFLEMDWPGTKVLVGDGPIRDELMKKHPQVVFAGKKVGHDLAEYYRASDVFVFPSKTDTFGIVLIEALACGLPVAAYNVMGPKDIITRPEYGVLDDDLSKAALQAIESVIPEKCVQHVKDKYSWDAAGKQFLNAL